MEKQAAFKKAMFGFDKESVITYIDALYNDSREEIEEIRRQMQEISDEKSCLQKELQETKELLLKTETQLTEEKNNALRFADGLRSLNVEMNRLRLDSGHKDYKIKELSDKVQEYEREEARLQQREEEGRLIIDKAREQAESMLRKAEEEKLSILQGAESEKQEVLHKTQMQSEEIMREVKECSADLEQKNVKFRSDIAELRESVRGLLLEMDRCLAESAEKESELSSEEPAAQEIRDVHTAFPCEPEKTTSDVSAEHFFRTAARVC